MKTIISILALALTLPVFAGGDGYTQKEEEKTEVTTPATDSAANEKTVPTEEDVQLEEDEEVQLPDGKEVEYDEDVFGDDEIEVKD